MLQELASRKEWLDHPVPRSEDWDPAFLDVLSVQGIGRNTDRDWYELSVLLPDDWERSGGGSVNESGNEADTEGSEDEREPSETNGGDETDEEPTAKRWDRLLAVSIRPTPPFAMTNLAQLMIPNTIFGLDQNGAAVIFNTPKCTGCKKYDLECIYPNPDDGSKGGEACE